MAEIIQIRRDTAANWTAANPVLAQGEMGLETDTIKIKWGNGVTAWNNLAYFTAAGGGGSNMKGSAVIDFGATPGGNKATVTVSDANILTTLKVIVFMSSEATADHNTVEHEMAPIKLTAGNIVNGVSFDIIAVSDWILRGTFNVNYQII